MSGRPYRLLLGSEFSEASRLIWTELERRGWSREYLIARVKVSRGAMTRYLYGDRRADRDVAIRFSRVLGIPVESWTKAPTRLFVPPAARKVA